MQSYDNLFEEATNIIVLGGSKIYWLTSFGNNYVCIQKHFILKKNKRCAHTIWLFMFYSTATGDQNEKSL